MIDPNDIRGTRELVELLRRTADRLEQDDYGGLTGVAVVVEAVSGIFTNPGPMTVAWVSPQGGKEMLQGLIQVNLDINALRIAKKAKVQ